MDLIPDHAERIYVGKRPGAHALTQDEISALMVKLAREGKRVLRLKGGDPFLFGRGGEEAEALAAAGVPFEVCPGVTAAAGAAASALIPLTHRDHAQACIFVTGQGKHGPTGLDWPALIRANQTVAIYMGLANLEALMAEFVARGAPGRNARRDRRQRDPRRSKGDRRHGFDPGVRGRRRRVARPGDRVCRLGRHAAGQVASARLKGP